MWKSPAKAFTKHRQVLEMLPHPVADLGTAACDERRECVLAHHDRIIEQVTGEVAIDHAVLHERCHGRVEVVANAEEHSPLSRISIEHLNAKRRILELLRHLVPNEVKSFLKFPSLHVVAYLGEHHNLVAVAHVPQLNQSDHGRRADHRKRRQRCNSTYPLRGHLRPSF